MSFIGPKSRCLLTYVPFGGYRGNLFPGLLQFPETTHIPWLMVLPIFKLSLALLPPSYKDSMLLTASGCPVNPKQSPQRSTLNHSKQALQVLNLIMSAKLL